MIWYWIRNVSRQACSVRGYVEISFIGDYGFAEHNLKKPHALSVEVVNSLNGGANGNNSGGVKTRVIPRVTLDPVIWHRFGSTELMSRLIWPRVNRRGASARFGCWCDSRVPIEQTLWLPHRTTVSTGAERSTSIQWSPGTLGPVLRDHCLPISVPPVSRQCEVSDPHHRVSDANKLRPVQ